jgi:hypothetical protein
MNDKDVVNIYWAPMTSYDVLELGDWNLLYNNPTNLYLDMLKLKNNKAKQNSFLSCPAVKEKFKKTFVFSSSIDGEYEYDFIDEENYFFNSISKNYLSYKNVRRPSLNFGPTIAFSLFYVFFSEESVNANFIPPIFHKPQYTNYGTVIPGEFDIGQWFRPYVFEVQMWNEKGKFLLKEDEPLFYVEFNTNKKINLQKFKFNAQLHAYVKNCVDSPNNIVSNVPLLKRYQNFKNTGMRNLILKEIKNNIIEDFK